MPVNVATKIIIGFEDSLNNLSTQASHVLTNDVISGGSLIPPTPNPHGKVVFEKFQKNGINSSNNFGLNSQGFSSIQGFVANGSANPLVVQGSLLAEESSNLLLPFAGTEPFATVLNPIVNSDSFKINGLPIDQFIEKQLEFWLTGDPARKIREFWNGLFLFIQPAAINVAEAFVESLSEFSRLPGELKQSLNLSVFYLFDEFENSMLDALKRMQGSIKKFFEDFEASIKGIASAKITTIEIPDLIGNSENDLNAFFRVGIIGSRARARSDSGNSSVDLNSGNDKFQAGSINSPGQNYLNQRGTYKSYQQKIFEVENINLNVPSDFRSRLTERQFAYQLRDEIFRLDRRMSK